MKQLTSVFGHHLSISDQFKFNSFEHGYETASTLQVFSELDGPRFSLIKLVRQYTFAIHLTTGHHLHFLPNYEPFSGTFKGRF